MDNKVLAIFDKEERYAYGLMEYMSEKPNLPFRIHVFTQQRAFYDFEKKEQIECLMLSEKLYGDEIERFNIPHIIILSESGQVIDNTLHHINKYQSCENIFKEIMKYYSDCETSVPPRLRTGSRSMKIIGIYTPIGRCLQTTFAFTLGQLLSQKFKTLYLNFEKYSGLSQMLKRDFNSDISDLMYYFQCAKEKLSIRLESVVESVNGLDFVPPAAIYQNLAGITKDQWIDLFHEMERCTEYEYLILDLTDGMVELWDVLRACDVVYTISRGDPMALAKMEQYEKSMEVAEYMDVLTKTKKYKFPIFQNLSVKFDELTHGELAQYVKQRVLPDVVSIGESNDY